MNNLKNKNVLVTGGAGFVGSHLIDLLLKQESPKKVVAASNFFLGKMSNLKQAKHLAVSSPSSEFIVERCELTDLEEIKDVVTKHSIDVVFNLAAIPLPTSLIKPEWSIKKNVDMTINICQLLREGLFDTLIQYSSSEALGTVRQLPMGNNHPSFPETPYAASKLATDHIALSYYNTYGCDIALIRPFNQYGPRQNANTYSALIPKIIKKMSKNEDVFITGDGSQTRDFNFVKDTVDATIEIYKNPLTRGKITHVGTGVERSILSVAQKTADLMHYKKDFIFTEERIGDVKRHCADSLEAEETIGWQPKTSFDKGMEETVSWYNVNPHAFC
jgi:UDP-glucose 4-epimerase